MEFTLTVVFVVNIIFARTERLSPEDPFAIEGQELNMTVVDVKPPIKSCQIVFKSSTPHYNINNESQYKDALFIANKSTGKCGVHLSSVQEKHKGLWKFNVTDADDKLVTFTAILMVYKAPPSPVDKHIRKHIGDTLDESCYAYNNHINYVKIYNPENKLVQQGNSNRLTINPLKLKHNGTWVCVLQLKGMLTEVNSTIFIEVLPNESNEISKTVTDTHVNLLYQSSSTPIPSCIFERPDGTGFSLIEGIRNASDHERRYSYYGFGFRKGYCGISIEQPLKHNDLGVWKCIAAPKGKVGGFVFVHDGDNKTSFSEIGKKEGALDSQMPRNITEIEKGTNTPVIKALEGSTIEISCCAKESLAYCYAKSPHGKIYWSTISGLLLGECYVQLSLAQGDNGTWFCGMGLQGYNAGYGDLEVEIDVLLYKDLIIVSKEPTMRLKLGESTKIACRTALDVGVKYCLFTRPDKTHIIIGSNKEDKYGNSTYTYNGEGLEKGDCSILINPIRKEDFGNWQCTASIVPALNKVPTDYEVTIEVKENKVRSGGKNHFRPCLPPYFYNKAMKKNGTKSEIPKLFSPRKQLSAN